MKIKYAFAILVLNLLFFACDKDENNSDNEPLSELTSPKFDEEKVYLDGNLIRSTKYVYEGDKLSSMVDVEFKNGKSAEFVSPVEYIGDTTRVKLYSLVDGDTSLDIKSVIKKDGKILKEITESYQGTREIELGISYFNTSEYEYDSNRKLSKISYSSTNTDGTTEYNSFISFKYSGDKLIRIDFTEIGFFGEMKYFDVLEYSGDVVVAVNSFDENSSEMYSKEEFIYEGRNLMKIKYFNLNEDTQELEYYGYDDEVKRNSSGQITEMIIYDADFDIMQYKYEYTYLEGSSNALEVLASGIFWYESLLFFSNGNSLGAKIDPYHQQNRKKKLRINYFKLLN